MTDGYRGDPCVDAILSRLLCSSDSADEETSACGVRNDPPQSRAVPSFLAHCRFNHGGPAETKTCASVRSEESNNSREIIVNFSMSCCCCQR